MYSCRASDGPHNAEQHTETVGVFDSVVILPNPKRRGLVISAPVGGRVTLGIGKQAPLDTGIQLFTGFPPVHYWEIGDG